MDPNTSDIAIPPIGIARKSVAGTVPEVVDEPMGKRRFAAKLRVLGSSAGVFLLLMIVAIGSLLALDMVPGAEDMLFWIFPLGGAAAVLAGVWASRKHQYEHPSLVWYLVLVTALFFGGVGWSVFLEQGLLAPDGPAKTVALVIVSAGVLLGALLFAVDLTVVSAYLIGLAAATAYQLFSSGVVLDMPMLVLLGGIATGAFLVALWGYRQQRQLVHSVAELSYLRPKYQALEHDCSHLQEQLGLREQRQKELERDLILTKEEAESAGIAKTEFLATMSHEIRTPLNGIVPILEILRETRLNPEQAEFVTTALNSSHHLLNLINDILDYSKIEAGKLELEIIELNIEELIESVVSLMTKSAERRGIHLTSKIARNVPKQVRGDPFRLRQILTNLVGNAIKFTSQGSVSVEVNRHASSPKDVVLLFAVRDTGIGMSQEAVGHLFQLFSQADASTTRKYGGTGLGLVICKRLVEIMGGRIGVKSEEDKGSVFWFVVPMRKALHEVPSARKSLQSVRALMAGFDELELQRLAVYLDEWGMLHEHSATSVDALTKLRASAKLGSSWSYDVLIVDAQTLGSGLGMLIKDIQKVFELSELVILAVDAFPSVASLVREAGAGEIIPRPVQEQELRTRLCRLLDVQTYKSTKKTEDEGRQVLMPDAQFSWEDGRSRGHVDRPLANERKSAALSSPVAAGVGDEMLVGRILVVEDNPVNLAVVKKVLERFGLHADEARDGVEALEAVKKIPYDLVLMDMQMPNMDGYQATSAIRKRELTRGLARMPVLAMTANAMTGDREKCLKAGMDDYMSKPIKPADLKNMLRHWLPSRPAAQSPAQPTAVRLENSVASPPAAPAAKVEAEPVDQVLDQEVLEELYDIMEAGTSALLQEYVNNAPGLLADVERAAGAGDATAMVLPAHSLKSSSANVGAMKVSELAKKLEFMGREDDMSQAIDTAQQLLAAFSDAQRELNRLIEKGGL